jgi:hypothetical protein
MPLRLTALAASVLAAAALLAGCGEKEENLSSTTATAPDAASIAGDWTGELTQAGLKPFQVAVRIEPPGSVVSRVAYTGIACAGEWAPQQATDVFVFTETITAGSGGKCKGTGTVTLTPQTADSLAYVFSGGGVQSSGVLARTDAAGLAPVFQQAGVAPPS